MDVLFRDVRLLEIDATSIRRKEVVRSKATIVMRLKKGFLDMVTVLLISLSSFFYVLGCQKTVFRFSFAAFESIMSLLLFYKRNARGRSKFH